MATMRCLILALFAIGCGPIDAPPQAVDLTTSPGALSQRFDAEVGIHRLVLLLSPA